MGKSGGLRGTTAGIEELAIVRIQGGEELSYLVEHIVQRVGAVNSKADKNQVSLWVGKRAKAVVFLLSGSVPQSQLYGLARRRMDGVGDVVFEDGRDVFLFGTIR